MKICMFHSCVLRYVRERAIQSASMYHLFEYGVCVGVSFNVIDVILGIEWYEFGLRSIGDSDRVCGVCLKSKYW